MPRPTAIVALRSIAPRNNRLLAMFVLLSLTALVTLVGGVACLVAHTWVAEPQRILAPSGVVLVVLAFAQGRLLWLAWRNPYNGLKFSRSGSLRFVRGLTVGAFLSYLACLAVGPTAWMGVACLTGIATWYTVMLLPLSAPSPVIERWRRWTNDHRARRLSWLVYASIVLAVAAEAGLRIQRRTENYSWSTLSASPSPSIRQVSFDSFDPLSEDDFVAIDRRISPRVFRVALLDERNARATKPAYLGRVEQMLPGLEFVRLDVQNGWSQRSAGEIAARVVAARADLALVVIQPCEELTRTEAETSWFDWRQLELARRIMPAGAVSPSQTATALPIARANDFEAFLRSVSGQLAACRTPIDEVLRARWQQEFDTLNELTSACRQQHVNLAALVVPAEFQVDRHLCDTLARRLGCTREELDLELPQRKLAGFAESHTLPLIDLLPYMRVCRQSTYERNATAWNERGEAAAASAISGWLESRYGRQLGVAAQLTSAP